jgi:Rhomboid family
VRFAVHSISQCLSTAEILVLLWFDVHVRTAGHQKELGPGAKNALNSIVRTVGINAFIGLQSTHIDNMAHLGGLLGGIALTFLFGPNLRWVVSHAHIFN